MNYFQDLYIKFYSLICSAHSWAFFIFTLIIGVCFVVGFQITEKEGKGQLTYFVIVSAVFLFLFKILFWLFFPSPEFLGWVK